MTPTKLKAKEFEQLILDAGARDKRMSIVRYGVQGALIQNEWRPISSLPDFDGALQGGKQFIIEAKVNSQATLQLCNKLIKKRQVSHMLERSRLGVQCYILLHWNEQILATKTRPAVTVAVPVDDTDARWELLAEGKDAGRLGRCESCEMGTVITWSVPPRCKKALPEIADLFFTKIQPELELI